MGAEDLLRIIRSQPPASVPRACACEVLVARYRGLVRACANRYRGSPEPLEDLVQVGYVGMMKAINNFDPGIGRNVGAYAQPRITGEIKRYFRDKRWHAHIERPMRELLLGGPVGLAPAGRAAEPCARRRRPGGTPGSSGRGRP